MKRQWEELFLIPLGLAAVVEERLKEITDTLIDRGKEKERELKEKLSEVKEKPLFATLEKKSSLLVDRLLKELDVPRKRDIMEIKREIEEIKRLLREKSCEEQK
ncbi:MAG: hypothetical protein GXO44_03665 [Deferribacteres bacterium]|nr:hypothetical protein [Deferribacteres bacterium]